MSPAPTLEESRGDPRVPPLVVEDLRVWYGDLQALWDVTFQVWPGKVLALIGETGSGKSTAALAAARLLPPKSRIEGHILLDGVDIATMTREEMRVLRPRLGFVSQDAMAALNPVLSVGAQVAEMFEVHLGSSRSGAIQQAIQILRKVQIPDPQAVVKLYPHQLSGGMRQRVMIAIALALGPGLLIADEPTTGLDVSVQAEILRIVMALRDETGAGVLWITHDMGVVAEFADAVAVMYAGRIIEEGPAEVLFDAPHHPYTEALLRTLRDSRTGSRGERLYQIAGQPPSLRSRIPGCPFHPRCPRAKELCEQMVPSLEAMGRSRAACHVPLNTEAT